MISPELIRRYALFADLDWEQIVALAMAAEEQEAAAGEYFFREGEELNRFYLMVEGKAAIVVELPGQDREVIVGTVGPGEMFGWSALVAPHSSTAHTRALTRCRVVAFDCRPLREQFERDPRFGYLMMEKAAQVIRQRMRDSRIEGLAEAMTRQPAMPVPA